MYKHLVFAESDGEKAHKVQNVVPDYHKLKQDETLIGISQSIPPPIFSPANTQGVISDPPSKLRPTLYGSKCAEVNRVKYTRIPLTANKAFLLRTAP